MTTRWTRMQTAALAAVALAIPLCVSSSGIASGPLSPTGPVPQSAPVSPSPEPELAADPVPEPAPAPVAPQLVPEPERSPASRLSRGDKASEYWDLSARFDSGHKLFARFTISNEGPGDETAYAIGQVVFPDGHVSSFQNGRLKGRWSLSEDRLRIEIGSSILDLHDPVREIEVDKNRAGQKIFLRYAGRPESSRVWASSPEGYALDLVDSGTPIEGTLWIRDVTEEPVSVAGSLTSTHTSMEVNESRQTLRRLELHAGGAGESVFLIDVLSPKGVSKRWLVVQRGGITVFQTDDFELAYEGTGSASTRDYPVPARLVVRGPEIEGQITLGALHVRHDPLEIAPLPFRWLLAGSTDPEHLWLDAETELTIKRGAAGGEDSPGESLERGFRLDLLRQRGELKFVNEVN